MVTLTSLSAMGRIRIVDVEIDTKNEENSQKVATVIPIYQNIYEKIVEIKNEENKKYTNPRPKVLKKNSYDGVWFDN